MYSDSYSEEIVKKLKKLKKKEPKHYLHYDMKGIKRVHIGHFVLVFVINHVKRALSFEDYDPHDIIYR